MNIHDWIGVIALGFVLFGLVSFLVCVWHFFDKASEMFEMATTTLETLEQWLRADFEDAPEQTGLIEKES